MFGSVTRKNVCHPLCAENCGSLFFLVALRLHKRNQFARHKRKSNENCGKYDARHGEYNSNAVVYQVRAEPAVAAEHENVNQAGDDRRDGERRVNQREQKIFSAKLEFRDCPGRRQTENGIQRDGDCRREQREAQRRYSVSRA